MDDCYQFFYIQDQNIFLLCKSKVGVFILFPAFFKITSKRS